MVGTVDNAVTEFYVTVIEIIDTNVPSFFRDSNNYPNWFSAALRKIIKEKSKYHRKWKKFKNLNDYDTFSCLRARQRRVQNECWHDHIKRCETHINTDPKVFWNYVKSQKGNNSVPQQVTYKNEVFTDGPAICHSLL